jgi:hypothetical protein
MVIKKMIFDHGYEPQSKLWENFSQQAKVKKQEVKLPAASRRAS